MPWDIKKEKPKKVKSEYPDDWIFGNEVKINLKCWRTHFFPIINEPMPDYWYPVEGEYSEKTQADKVSLFKMKYRYGSPNPRGFLFKKCCIKEVRDS